MSCFHVKLRKQTKYGNHDVPNTNFMAYASVQVFKINNQIVWIVLEMNNKIKMAQNAYVAVSNTYTTPKPFAHFVYIVIFFCFVFGENKQINMQNSTMYKAQMDVVNGMVMATYANKLNEFNVFVQ